VAVGVVDRLEPVDVHERDRERLRVAARPLDLGGQGPEQRLAVGDPGQAVPGCLSLGHRERAGGAVEGPGQPALCRDAGLLEHDRRTLVNGLLEVLGQPRQPEGEVEPRGEGHGGGAKADGEPDQAHHEAARLRRLVDEHRSQQGEADGGHDRIQEADQPKKPEQRFLQGTGR
jgi:hypothetical protein